MSKYKEFDEILEDFQQYHQGNIFEDTRKGDVVRYRQLFHTILRVKHKFNLQEIADYTTYKGRLCDHATIINSVKRTVNTNYYSFTDIAEIYDRYITNLSGKRAEKSYYEHLSDMHSNRLVDIIKNIPKERLDEVCELLELRIKSWAWKSKDKCEVITVSDSISEYTF